MGTYEDFDLDFANRTEQILIQYEKCIPTGKENYEVTLLLNCLLGLVILPQERRFSEIPDLGLDAMDSWGLRSSFVCSWGKVTARDRNTLPGLIHRLRNSIAHLIIEAHGSRDNISEIEFRDKNGFRLLIPVDNLKQFVKSFSKYMAQVKVRG